MKNPFQPFRDVLPWYPFCIRTFLLLALALILLIFGSILIEEGKEKEYCGYHYDFAIGEYLFTCQGKAADPGKLAGGSIMIILGVPMVITGIILYYFLGCGYNRFYTNNLIKFEGRGAVKKARRNKRS